MSGIPEKMKRTPGQKGCDFPNYESNRFRWRSHKHDAGQIKRNLTQGTLGPAVE